ncbi:hypothetical protein KJ765_01955 [Candidatus Micrarchaeota archaeon]|nr:hypothetical protein [Candidatus Micrarchaeota archaeon]
MEKFLQHLSKMPEIEIREIRFGPAREGITHMGFPGFEIRVTLKKPGKPPQGKADTPERYRLAVLVKRAQHLSGKTTSFSALSTAEMPRAKEHIVFASHPDVTNPEQAIALLKKLELHHLYEGSA